MIVSWQALERRGARREALERRPPLRGGLREVQRRDRPERGGGLPRRELRRRVALPQGALKIWSNLSRIFAKFLHPGFQYSIFQHF